MSAAANMLLSCHCSLEMKPLVDLTSRALARMIEGKTPEEIRATFKLPDDLTEEEKLEPLKSGLADARIKLLNKLYAKKRQVGVTCLSTPAVLLGSPHVLRSVVDLQPAARRRGHSRMGWLRCRAWR